MSKITRGSFSLMKQLNISAILEVIRSHKKISRAEIAKITGLTAASVTNITKQLLQSNLIEETGVSESMGGRPRVYLSINSKAFYVIGCNLGPGFIDMVIGDIDSNILTRKRREITDIREDVVLNTFSEMIEEIIDENKDLEEKIIGIGIACHGIVNINTGIIEFSPFYHWNNTNIKEYLEDKFGYPVFIDNDVRTMALGEIWFGKVENISNFILVYVSNGIGAGIVINRKLYYGTDFSAGEIGHIVVDYDGPRCNCGNYGCLESFASNASIVKKSVKLIRQGVETRLKSLCDNHEENINVKMICQAANEGDKMAVDILEETGRYLGVAISNLVNILNPRSIVIVGDIMEASDVVLSSIKTSVNKLSLKLPAKNINIIPSVLGSNAAVIGAVTLVLQQIFKGEGI